LTTCTTAGCGDGFVQAGVEACDDGNADQTDACLSTCAAASCGDGFAQAGVEACDDGNAIETDACLSTCAAASCGDGFAQAGVEAAMTATRSRPMAACRAAPRRAAVTASSGWRRGL
jgi:cysteine-rich repeat protein